MASNSILGDIGKVDNLHDPEPFMNRKEVILGIVISFLVCCPTVRAIPGIHLEAFLMDCAGFVFIKRHRTDIYSIMYDQELGFG